MRGELLKEACQLAECTPPELPDQIRKMAVEQFRVEDSKRLREENARLNLDIGALKNENQAARAQAETVVAATEKIRMFANQAGEVVAKVELFDEKVGIGSKPSGTRIALILTDYSRKGRSPAKKDEDEIMTSASKRESESGTEDFPISDLHQRRRTQSRSPDQETVEFVTPKMTK
jgi:hypothetical protein